MSRKNKKNARQRTSSVKLDIAPEEKITMFDMRSCNTTTLKLFERGGGMVIDFQVPSCIRISKENP